MGNSSSSVASAELLAAKKLLGPARTAKATAQHGLLVRERSPEAVASQLRLSKATVDTLFSCVNDVLGTVGGGRSPGVAAAPAGSFSVEPYVAACAWATSGTKSDKLPLYYGLFVSRLSLPLSAETFSARLPNILMCADSDGRRPSAAVINMLVQGLFADGKLSVTSDDMETWLRDSVVAAPILDTCLAVFVLQDRGTSDPLPTWHLKLPQPSQLLAEDQAFVIDAHLPVSDRGHWELLFCSKTDGKSFSAFR